MNTGHRIKGFARLLGVAALLLTLGACTEDPSQGDTHQTVDDEQTSTAKTTTISGKVSLSGIVAASKPGFKIEQMATAPNGKPGSQKHKASRKVVDSSEARLPGFAAEDVVSDARVYLYDASHPEWLAPIAEAATDSSGYYELTTLANADKNGNAYKDGESIPVGKYTLLAYKPGNPGGFDPIKGRYIPPTDPIVAVQTVVKDFSESAVSGNDLVAQQSDAVPTVQSMFGARKNTDGTETWGSANLALPTNAAVQVTFSMAMARGSIESGIDISPAGLNGHWAVSPDWLSATFYLDENESLEPDTVYTVTVNGGINNELAVRNVYGNPVAKTATGTFKTAATSDPTPPNTSAYLYPAPKDKNAVDVSNIAIRIKSDEVLDVNKLIVTPDEGSPSLGAQPGVLYVGEKQDDLGIAYVYELLLGEPLKGGRTYKFTISGGTDLAGNLMNSATLSFTTAAEGAGIDRTQDATTQDVQAEVAEAFGKWVRAFNDRNLTQLQGMMSPDFVMEEDNSRGLSDEDLNRDGRLSLSEFSNMIDRAFGMWESCGTTLKGTIDGMISIGGTATDASFAFSLTGTSTETYFQCLEAAPKEELYATLKKSNGAWLVTRMSSGVDTRTDPLVKHGVVTLVSPANGEVFDVAADYPLTFSWEAVDGASSYIMIGMDANRPEFGVAYALPSTAKSLKLPTAALPTGAFNISSLFFEMKGGGVGVDQEGQGLAREGAEFKWEVIALSTYTASQLSDFGERSLPLVVSDIKAVSKLNWFKNSGELQELSVTVAPTGSTQQITYDTYLGGYDAVAANSVKVTITTPNNDAFAAQLNVSGHGQGNYTVPLTSGTGSVTMDLYNGWNWIEVWDGVSMSQGFSVVTTGGKQPVIKVTGASGANAQTLELDAWGYIEDANTATVTITGVVSDSSITEVNVSLWNDTGANSWATVPVTNGNFTASNVKVYDGDNWINIADSSWTNQAHFGLYNAPGTGSTWVAPITVEVAEATQTGNYGNSGDWTVTDDENSDGFVTVTGIMANPGQSPEPYYSISADAFWDQGSLSLATDGSFTINVPRYMGWTWVSLEDGSGNWYGVNLYSETGIEVTRPEVSSIIGGAVAYDGSSGSFIANQCSVTIEGTAAESETLSVNWNGNFYDDAYGYTQYVSEQQTVIVDEFGTFSVVVPVISGTNASNYVDIYDSQWWGTGLSLSTTADCGYEYPVNDVNSVTDQENTLATLSDFGNGSYAANFASTGTVTGVSVEGTHNKEGQRVTAETYACGNRMVTNATVVNGVWVIPDIPVYDGYNSININDGHTWGWIEVQTTNGIAPPPSPFSVSLVVGNGTASPTLNDSSCDWSDWNAGDATQVTISGVTDATQGAIGYSTNYGSGEVPVGVDGSFSVTLELLNGYNWVGLSDPYGRWQSVNIYAENNVLPPQIVNITSPAHSEGVTGLTQVNGHIDNTSMVIDQTTIWAYTYDWNTQAWAEYTIDSGVTLNSDGTFSFNADLVAGNQTEVRVEACDYMSCHGHLIFVNNFDNSSSDFWKAGSSKEPLAKKYAVEQRKRDALMRLRSKGRH